MNNFRINKDDLGELYLLLHVYIRTNGTEQRDMELLSEVAGLYYKTIRQSASQELPDVCVPGPTESQDDIPDNPEPIADADINAKYSFFLQEDAETADAASAAAKDIKEQIREMHRNGETIRAIAAQVHKSTTYVHRAIHEQA